MIVEELWSSQDEAALAAFRAALLRSDLAAALFAIEAVPPGTAEADRALMLGWAREVARRLGPSADATAQCEALAEVIARENDVRGSPEAFQHDWSSHLHSVLQRRRGLPILLAAVWMEVGRMAGLEVAGIGLPGHFLVRVGGRHGVFADPFSGGKVLSVDECRTIVRRISAGKAPWHASYLAPRSLPQITERVLNNLVKSYEGSATWAALYRTLSFLVAVRGDAPQPLLQRGLLALRLGALPLAQRDLAEVQRRFPGTAEAATAAAKMAAARGGLLH
jgi:regulator of sirC expression with transglutaminase-like and TPR domain